MSASGTPRTDAVALDQREGIKHPELCDTYMAWTDYWALRELARQLERELAAAKARIAELESALDIMTDFREKSDAERDALRAELAAARAWRDEAVMNCAKRQCALRDRRIAELEAELASAVSIQRTDQQTINQLMERALTSEAERDALRAELAATKANISDLYEVVRAFVHVAQHGPYDPSPLDENSPLMDAARDALAKVRT